MFFFSVSILWFWFFSLLVWKLLNFLSCFFHHRIWNDICGDFSIIFQIVVISEKIITVSLRNHLLKRIKTLFFMKLSLLWSFFVTSLQQGQFFFCSLFLDQLFFELSQFYQDLSYPFSFFSRNKEALSCYLFRKNFILYFTVF